MASNSASSSRPVERSCCSFWSRSIGSSAAGAGAGAATATPLPKPVSVSAAGPNSARICALPSSAAIVAYIQLDWSCGSYQTG
ncbi:MAG: hypothetical protein QOE06_2954 [Thermoleophilaceae bacterium]|nr:hypothetical protein [Thermoleophilaceae bacterium]